MTTGVAGPRRRDWRWFGHLARRAVVAEIRGYQAIFRFVFRRPRVPPGAAGFSYHKPILTLIIVFIAVSAVELVMVDLVVRRWTYIRIPLLILSIWGLVWMVGMLCGMLTRPHAVGPDGIRVRYGAEVDIPIGWDDIDSVALSKHSVQNKQPKVTVDDRGAATLHMRVNQETNLELTLDRPIRLRLPHGPETVSKVTLYADEPRAFLDEVRRLVG